MSLNETPHEGEQGSPVKKRSKKLFTSEEDEMMRRLVQIHGEKAWKVIAAALPGRSTRQCRERWRNYLSPSVRSMPWTVNDDQKLESLITQFGTQWARIATFFEYRTDVNVKNRWVLLKRNERRVLSQKENEQKAGPDDGRAGEEKEVIAVGDHTNDGNQGKNLIEFWGAEEWDCCEDYEVPNQRMQPKHND